MFYLWLYNQFSIRIFCVVLAGSSKKANVAQAVEQRFRKPQVPGSSPGVGSITRQIICVSNLCV